MVGWPGLGCQVAGWLIVAARWLSGPAWVMASLGVGNKKKLGQVSALIDPLSRYHWHDAANQ